MSSNTSVSVSSLLEKLEAIDADIRFMALSDLQSLLTNPAVVKQAENDNMVTGPICRAVVDKLDDPVSDVQSQAVKL